MNNLLKIALLVASCRSLLPAQGTPDISAQAPLNSPVVAIKKAEPKFVDALVIEADENTTWKDFSSYVRKMLSEGKSRFILQKGIRAVSFDGIKDLEGVNDFNNDRSGAKLDPYDPPERGVHYRFENGRDQFQFNGKKIELEEHVKKLEQNTLVVEAQFPGDTKLSVVFDKLFNIMRFPQVKSFCYVTPE